MTHNEIYYKALKSFPYGDLSSIMTAIRIAIEEEREACAKIADDEDAVFWCEGPTSAANSIAERIRARCNGGEK